MTWRLIIMRFRSETCNHVVLTFRRHSIAFLRIGAGANVNIPQKSFFTVEELLEFPAIVFEQCSIKPEESQYQMHLLVVENSGLVAHARDQRRQHKNGDITEVRQCAHTKGILAK